MGSHYFAAIGNENDGYGAIYGIGTSEREALKNAVEGAGYATLEQLLDDG